MTSKEKVLRRALILACEPIFGVCNNCPATPCPAHICQEDDGCKKRIIAYYKRKAKEELK